MLPRSASVILRNLPRSHSQPKALAMALKVVSIPRAFVPRTFVRHFAHDRSKKICDTNIRLSTVFRYQSGGGVSYPVNYYYERLALTASTFLTDSLPVSSLCHLFRHQFLSSDVRSTPRHSPCKRRVALFHVEAGN